MHFFRSAADFFLSPPFAGNHGERQENSAALPRINCGLKKRKGSYSPTPQFLYLFRSEQQKVQFFSRKQGRHKLAEKKGNKILHLPLQLVSRTTAPQKSETRISRIIDFLNSCGEQPSVGRVYAAHWMEFRFIFDVGHMTPMVGVTATYSQRSLSLIPTLEELNNWF